MADDGELLRIAVADTARLAAATGETALLARIDGNETVYMDETGRRVPLLHNAIGKALAACLDSNARRSLLNGRGNAEVLAAELDLIRVRGYAIDAAATAAVAAPIVGRDGRAVAAIAIEGLGADLSRARLHQLAPAVIEATRNATTHAGGTLRPMSKSPRPAAGPSPAVKVLVDTRNLIGESPFYDAANDRLFWVDMYDPAIFRFDCRSGELVSLPQSEMVMALAQVPEGMLIAAQSGIWLAEPERFERIRFLGSPEKNIPTNRFNDGKCDGRGRLWINTLDLDFAAGSGALYRMDAPGEFAALETGLTVPNGMGWSPDNRTLYLVETRERSIYAYDFSEETGEISGRRTLVRLPDDIPGAPDGMTIDAHGNLWVALFDGWRVCRFSPDGRLLEEIVMPVPRPTSCALGGRDGRTLFVTSARIRVAEAMLAEAPHSGAVFEISL